MQERNLKEMEGAMPRGDQLSRQWRLIQLIGRPQGITVDDAARDLSVTVRTVWRDLDVLQKAGFPLYTERAADGNRGVWRVTEEFTRALPLKLTLGELVDNKKLDTACVSFASGRLWSTSVRWWTSGCVTSSSSRSG